MPKRIDDATKAAIQKDAAEGMSIEEIRKKHQVGWGTANAIVRERGGRKAAKSKRAKRLLPSSSNGDGNLKSTPAMLDALWSALPSEKKINFLNFIYAPERS